MSVLLQPTAAEKALAKALAIAPATQRPCARVYAKAKKDEQHEAEGGG